MSSETSFENGPKLQNPAVNGRVVDPNPTVCHELRDSSETQWITKVKEQSSPNHVEVEAHSTPQQSGLQFWWGTDDITEVDVEN